ncbi:MULTISPECIES: glutaredoxin domain-containing protein [Kytococcus]|uniref:glutaredoxin domain-containing protein n=1 Tax=Kytococcus TaxID=57499 RepID=UPI0008A198A2
MGLFGATGAPEGRATTHAEVTALPADEREVVVYWRPGCGFCARLRRGLGDLAERAWWVNVWEDDEASAFVRSVNGGNEVVPTVVVDLEPVTNPAPSFVRDRLAGEGAADGGAARAGGAAPEGAGA